MAYFYGKVAGQRPEPIGMGGTKVNGLSVTAASYKGAIRVEVYVDDDGDKVGALVSEQVPIPEPATLVLLGTGLLAMGKLVKKAKR